MQETGLFKDLVAGLSCELPVDIKEGTLQVLLKLLDLPVNKLALEAEGITPQLQGRADALAGLEGEAKQDAEGEADLVAQCLAKLA